MKVLGIIPARGGSKGIPNKNIKDLGGKPLLQYTIESALESALLNKVILSTDSHQIAILGKELGVEVPFMRPDELALDTTPSVAVIKHALNYMNAGRGHYDAVCLLQPTCPFRPAGFIDQAIGEFLQEDVDSLISVRRMPAHYNPHWAFIPDDQGRLQIATGEKKIIPRRQELPLSYYRDGAIYIITSESMLDSGSMLGSNLGYIENTSETQVNLDDINDWQLAEQLLKKPGRHDQTIK